MKNRPSAAPVLQVHGISKRFHGAQALSSVDFELNAGEVMALVGENGAGKSTLIKILAGALLPDSGTMFLDGQPYAPRHPAEAKAAGLAVIYQDFQLVPVLTVAQNLLLHDIPRRRLAGILPVVDSARMADEARATLDQLGIAIDPRRRVWDLTAAEKQLVEIAKALSARARIIIMDEPTASLEPYEVERLLELIAQLRTQGSSIVFISHKIDEVLRIADRITALRDGEVVGRELAKDVSPQDLIQLIVGRELTAIFPKVQVPIGEVRLEARGLLTRNLRQPANLQVRQGEILAVTGLRGSGAIELLRAIYAQDHVLEGEVRVEGATARLGSPSAAIARGMGLVPEDRKNEGILPNLSIEDNIILPNLKQVTVFGFISRRRARALVEPLMAALRIKALGRTVLVKYLSGGNQQKVVIARWLASHARIVLMGEPTHGVDVGAKAEVHRLMGDFVAGGGSVVFAGSELEEVLGVSDRVMVLHQGELTAELETATADQQQIMAAATGVQADNRMRSE